MKILNLITLRYLKMNKSRTLITIVGIIISAAMITAVTTTISSFRTWMLEGKIASDGIYHVYSQSIPADEAKKITSDSEVKDAAIIYTHSYARFTDFNSTLDSFHGYYSLCTLSDNFGDIRAWKLSDGRMPENENEIMLPSGLSNYIENTPQIGESVTLSLGNRRAGDGSLLFENNVFLLDEKYGDERETFEITEEREYTVVGYYDSTFFSFGMNDLSAYAVRIVTGDCSIKPTHENLYLILNDIKKYESFISRTYNDYNLSDSLNGHYDYLSLNGAIPGSGYNVIFVSLGSVLIAIIAIASLSLIGSAFSISVTERTKQFGLLSSIGATKKQLRKSVITEAMLISVIAIPIGILSGIIGMAVTFECIEDTIKIMLYEFTNCSADELKVRVVPSINAILIAIISGVVTVYFSACFPARRAMKMSPLDAIRSSRDINVKPKSLKTSRFAKKVLGFEGTLASKYFKRSKKKYRATVISISLSVLLFIVAGTVISYLGTLLKTNYSGYDHHYSVYLYNSDSSNESREDVIRTLKSEECIDEINVSQRIIGYYIRNRADTDEEWFDQGKYSPLTIVIIDDDAFEKFLDKNHLDKNKYLNPDNKEFLFTDFDTVLNSNEGNKTVNIFRNENAIIECVAYTRPADVYPTALDNNTGMVSFSDKSENVHMKDYEGYAVFGLGERIDESPIGYNGSNRLHVYIPNCAVYGLLPKIDMSKTSTYIYMNVHDPKNDFTKIKEIVDMYPSETGLSNSYEEYTGIRALFDVFSVLSYGFIILMSVISLINMFSTISTNIYLRKRDFAILASVGMTSSGTMKMMLYECFLYGSKGLIYGIPLSLISSVFISMALEERMRMSVTLPIGYVLISIVSVFLVIGIAMIYSISNIRRENTVETVRTETA